MSFQSKKNAILCLFVLFLTYLFIYFTTNDYVQGKVKLNKDIRHKKYTEMGDRSSPSSCQGRFT